MSYRLFFLVLRRHQRDFGKRVFASFCTGQSDRSILQRVMRLLTSRKLPLGLCSVLVNKIEPVAARRGQRKKPVPFRGVEGGFLDCLGAQTSCPVVVLVVPIVRRQPKLQQGIVDARIHDVPVEKVTLFRKRIADDLELEAAGMVIDGIEAIALNGNGGNVVLMQQTGMNNRHERRAAALTQKRHELSANGRFVCEHQRERDRFSQNAADPFHSRRLTDGGIVLYLRDNRYVHVHRADGLRETDRSDTQVLFVLPHFRGRRANAVFVRRGLLVSFDIGPVRYRRSCPV